MNFQLAIRDLCINRQSPSLAQIAALTPGGTGAGAYLEETASSIIQAMRHVPTAAALNLKIELVPAQSPALRSTPVSGFNQKLPL